MCEKNRLIVQRGLALRAIKSAAIRQEAAQETASRAMCQEINFRSKWHQIENETAQANQRREKMVADQRAARRAHDAKKAQQWSTFLKRTFAPVGIAAMLHILHAVGAIQLWLAVSGMVLTLVYIIVNYVAYATRNNRKGE